MALTKDNIFVTEKALNAPVQNRHTSFHFKQYNNKNNITNNRYMNDNNNLSHNTMISMVNTMNRLAIAEFGFTKPLVDLDSGAEVQEFENQFIQQKALTGADASTGLGSMNEVTKFPITSLRTNTEPGGIFLMSGSDFADGVVNHVWEGAALENSPEWGPATEGTPFTTDSLGDNFSRKRLTAVERAINLEVRRQFVSQYAGNPGQLFAWLTDLAVKSKLLEFDKLMVEDIVANAVGVEQVTIDHFPIAATMREMVSDMDQNAPDAQWAFYLSNKGWNAFTSEQDANGQYLADSNFKFNPVKLTGTGYMGEFNGVPVYRTSNSAIKQTYTITGNNVSNSENGSSSLIILADRTNMISFADSETDTFDKFGPSASIGGTKMHPSLTNARTGTFTLIGHSWMGAGMTMDTRAKYLAVA